MELLERASHLAMLEEHLRAAQAGHGRLVMVGGEAGVGKTALVQTFAQRAAQHVTVLRASCEATSTPTPVGPTRDLAPALGLTLDLERMHGDEVYHAVLEALRRQPGPTVIVGEDAQWADSISLEFLRFMARRASLAPVLFIITYRDDELRPDHPLRLMLGDLASSGVATRLTLSPLSREGVTYLAARSGRDADQLYQLTGGNPFFVTQVLAAGEGEIPATVTDAVLARAARLPAEARGVLDICAVIGGRIDPELVLAVAGAVTDEVDACIMHGLLLAAEGAPYLRFRHDLMREAVLAAIPPMRRRLLHGRILASLRQRPGCDAARLAHHAEAAGSPETADLAVAAAEQALARRAYREAVDQYARALRCAAGAPAVTRLALYEGHAAACQRAHQDEAAIASWRAAIALSAEMGDRVREGDNQRRLSQHYARAGYGTEAEAAARAAVQVLEQRLPSVALAKACSNLASLCSLAYDDAGVAAWAERAEHLATTLGDSATAIHARISLASSLARRDHAAGIARLEACASEARAAGCQEHACLALTNLAWAALETGQVAEAASRIAQALAHAAAAGLRREAGDLVALRSLVACWRGDWQGVMEDAASPQPNQAPLGRIVALAALGRMQARRGDREAEETLAEARRLAERSGDCRVLWLASTAQAEHEILRGGPDAAAGALAAIMPVVEARGTPWQRGEVAWLAQQAGLPVPDGEIAAPWSLHLAGRWEAAAGAWDALEAPYDAAFARLQAGGIAQVQQAAQVAATLQARPLLARCNVTLRRRGARVAPVPRGPRPSTQAHPAGLTQREVEVLDLVVAGLTNAGIAERLFLTPKTVSHHLSAIYAKLGAANRVEAARMARTMAPAAQSGEVAGTTWESLPMPGERLA